MKTAYDNRQQGSAHVVVIIVLIIALIGALGYIFWSNVLQPKPKDDTAATNTAAKTTSPSPSTTPQAETGTITLADWKVKLTIPDSLKNTSVTYNQEKAGSYGFTTARIQALGGDCATQPYGKSVVLNRVTSIPANAMDGFVQINKQPIGGYYYTYTETIPACSGSTTDPSVSVNKTEITDTAALTELLKSLQLAQ